jgi:hypothetical protein
MTWIPILSISWGIFFENKEIIWWLWNHGIKKLKNKEVAPIVIEKEVDDFVDENDAMEVSEPQRRKPLPLLLKWRKLK